MFLQKNVCYNDEMNERIYHRTNLDYEGQSHFLFDPRPTQTKQTVFLIPINNSHTAGFKDDEVLSEDKLNQIFPDISKEIMLRNQTVALQHGAEQGVYVPSSTSNLYFSYPIKKEENINNLITENSNENKSQKAKHENKIGSNTFYNNTRTQLRNNWNF